MIAGCAVLSIGFNTYSFKVNLASDGQAEQVTEIFGNNNMFMVLFERERRMKISQDTAKSSVSWKITRISKTRTAPTGT